MTKPCRKLSLLLAFIFALSMFMQVLVSAEPVQKIFTDIFGHWAEAAIEEWAEKGIIYGYDGKFNPESGIKRAEFCAIINRVFGFSEKSETNFDDVKPDKWYYNDVAIAKKAGYIAGYGNNLFGPEDKITRQDASRILYTVFKFDDLIEESNTAFSDDSEIASYAKEAAVILSSKGYILGDNNNFYPKKPLTRAQFVAIIDRAVNEFFIAAGTYKDISVSENVIVRTGDVVLKNLVIEGNLYLAEGIGQGEVVLDNVIVKGTTFANGGGENSIIITNSTLNSLVIMKVDGKIRIVAKDNTTISNAKVNSGAILKTDSSTGGSIQNVEILQEIPSGHIVTLDGDFNEVSIIAPGISLQIPDGIIGNLIISETAEGANIEIAQGASVGLFKAGAAANISGRGSIETAEINAADVIIEQKPNTTKIAEGIKANVGGKEIDSTSANTPVSTPSVPRKMWTLTWSDEFNSSEVDVAKWTLVDSGGGFGNQEAQYYSPNNASVSDGKLVMSAKKEIHPKATSETYTSAKLASKFSQKYGKFEARIKLPLGAGLWPAFWMMPQDDVYGGWASSGEIDIMEARGRTPDTVCGTLHYGGAWPNNVYSGKEYILPEGQTINEFHTYSVEWEPGEIRWYVDGILYQTQNNWYTMGSENQEKYAFPAPFDQEFFMQLNLAVGGTFDGMVTPPDEIFNSPVTMEVDYVRAYELTGRPYKTPVEPSITAEPLPVGARQADNTGNLVYDVNYANGIKDNQEGLDANFGDDWNFVHNAQFGGVATASVEDINGSKYAKIDVTDKGTQPYSVQLEQLTTLGKGRWYKFSFDAKADKSRTLSSKLGGGPTAGWTAYSGSYTANLTNDFQNFEYEFQMTKDSDILTRIEFNCATDTGPVWIGNVRVEEIAPPTVDYNAEKEPLSDGNHVHNGAFDKYTIDRLSCWNFEKTDATAVVGIPERTRELTVEFSNGGSAADSFTVYQQGLKLLKDNDYKLTFKARANAARTIKVVLTDTNGTAYIPAEEISLTTEMKSFEFPFTMSADTDTKSVLKFLLGGNNAYVYIDDVKLINNSNYIDPSVEFFPLKNGDFSNPTFDPWKTYQVEGGAATFTVDEGKAKISTTILGGNPWNVMLTQEDFEFSKGVEYLVEFDACSTVSREIGVILENASYTKFFDKTVSLTPDMQRFSFTFMMAENQTLNLKFLLGNFAGATLSDILIDNVVCEVVTAKQNKNLLENGTFTGGTDRWTIFNADWEGASVAPTINNGMMELAIGYEGTQFWSIQLIQDITKEALSAEKSYVLTFEVSSDVDRNIQAIVENKNTNSKYLWETLAATSNKKTYSLKFAGVDDAEAHVVFALGKIDDAVGRAHTISISNISLIENPYGFTPSIPPIVIPGVNIVTDGSFDSDIGEWDSWWGDEWSGGVTSGDAIVADGMLKVTVDSIGTASYNPQIFRPNFTLVKGTTYEVSFKAKADKDWAVNVNIGKPLNNDPWFINYAATQNYNLTTDLDVYTFIFTVVEDTCNEVKLVFEVGKIGDNVAPVVIYLDDISIKAQ